ncbi:MAG TPA: lipid-A-disaccharide synthase [Bacteroidota bacterium]|nr:lipid-A-disaccharide synthase [Bacteroidota bacterium]
MASGEISGDRQGGHLARTLKSIQPDLRLYGSGGEKMSEAGVELLARTSEFGSVGFQESLRFVRPLRAILRRLRETLIAHPPDLAVLIDSEGFNGILARFLYREGIPYIYYFPPQVWFWGKWRAKEIARRARLIVTAFQPEAEIYAAEGGNVFWAGHPLLDIVSADAEPAGVLRRLGLDPERPAIALLPGSRVQEVEQLTGDMLGAYGILRAARPDLQCILPVAGPHVRPIIEREINRRGLSRRVIPVYEHVYAAMSSCRLAILASGTATLEAALLGVPMVICYRVKPFTYLIGRRLLKSDYIGMPNILLGREAVPEVLQERVDAQHLASAAGKILDNPAYARKIREDLSGLAPMLGERGVLMRVAEKIVTIAREVHAHARYESVP